MLIQPAFQRRLIVGLSTTCGAVLRIKADDAESRGTTRFIETSAIQSISLVASSLSQWKSIAIFLRQNYFLDRPGNAERRVVP